MPYAGLGARRVAGTSADNINWTVQLDPATLGVSTGIPYFEIYHTSVASVPGATFSRFVEINQWDAGIYGNSNTDDPNEPMLIQPGQTVYFYFTYPSANATPPVVTVWLRYDRALLSALCHGLTRSSSRIPSLLRAAMMGCSFTVVRPQTVT